MTTMVRKQVYIKPKQDELLKQWAEETGKSEAEILRQALDRWLESEEQRQEAEAAWEQILAFSEERAELGAVAEGRSWAREELYEERLNRYDRRAD
ncbi:MAG: type II toxin-antitoxin system VapB family antitoxin [Anaerolineales bacterium]